MQSRHLYLDLPTLEPELKRWYTAARDICAFFSSFFLVFWYFIITLYFYEYFYFINSILVLLLVPSLLLVGYACPAHSHMVSRPLVENGAGYHEIVV